MESRITGHVPVLYMDGKSVLLGLDSLDGDSFLLDWGPSDLIDDFEKSLRLDQNIILP